MIRKRAVWKRVIRKESDPEERGLEESGQKERGPEVGSLEDGGPKESDPEESCITKGLRPGPGPGSRRSETTDRRPDPF